MWHFISEQISQQTQQAFICDDVRQISTGDSHQAFRISDGKHRYFVKVNEKCQLENFNAEIEGLNHLRQTALFKIPKVICTGLVSTHSFLVLEYLHMQEGTKDMWMSFGQALAHMHKNHTQQKYGWQEDNFIGTTLQANKWNKKWAQFFAEQRIGFMLQLLLEKGHHLGDLEKVIQAVEKLLAGYNPVASMLHGDLWQGNVGFYKEQNVMFDPAFYYGDRETDLAMTELFGRFPDTFYQAYNNTWPIDNDYLYRKPIYQLYHTLNHALLFGGYYVDSAKQMIKHLDI